MKENKKNISLLLGNWGEWSIKHWKTTLLIGFLITILLGIGFAFLKMEMNFYSLIPHNQEKVDDLNKLIDLFPSASTIIAVVQGDTREKVIGGINAIENEMKKEQYKEYVSNVIGQINREFFMKNYLLFLSEEDFNKVLSNSFDKDELTMILNKKAELMPLLLKKYISLPDSGEIKQLNFELSQKMFGSGDEQTYFISSSGKMGLVFIEPTYTMNDIDKLGKGTLLIEKGVKTVEKTMGIKAGITGITVVGKDEMMSSEKGLYASSIVAFILILLLLIINFRMVSVPFISGIPLILGIIWTIGLTGLVVHRLNIMTGMYMIALLGLGIDFAIHLLTGFVQERENKLPPSLAMKNSFSKSGKGILIGGLTTAFAFFALITAKSSIIKELGLVAGLGIFCQLLAMFILIPGLIGLRYAGLIKKQGENNIDKYDSILLRKSKAKGLTVFFGKLINKNPYAFTALFLSITIFLAFFAGKVNLETNIMNMEAKGLESIALQDKMVKEFNMAPDSLFILTKDINEVYLLDRKLKALSSVKEVESIASILPEKREQEKRLEKIALYQNQLSQLLKTSQNQFYGYLLSQYPDAKLTENDSLYLRFYLMEISNYLNPELITLNSVPEDLKSRYVSKDNQYFMINILPKKNPWVYENRKQFVSQVNTVSDRATGMVLAGDLLVEIAKKDGVQAAIIALLIIFIIIALDFKNILKALLTIFPLLFSMISLFGIMAIFKIKFDFVNIITIPLLIGIGVDDAIHFMHRYQLEGKGNMDRVIEKIGQAVLMTTLTTVIGFASFIPSVMRAMRSTGIVLSVALILAFLNSFFLMTSLTVIIYEKLFPKLKLK